MPHQWLNVPTHNPHSVGPVAQTLPRDKISVVVENDIDLTPHHLLQGDLMLYQLHPSYLHLEKAEGVMVLLRELAGTGLPSLYRLRHLMVLLQAMDRVLPMVESLLDLVCPRSQWVCRVRSFLLLGTDGIDLVLVEVWRGLSVNYLMQGLSMVSFSSDILDQKGIY